MKKVASGAVAKPLGLNFSSLSTSGVVDLLASRALRAGEGVRMVLTANVDHVVQVSRNRAFRDAYRSAFLVTADGMPVYLYARLRGAAAPSRVTGADIFAELAPRLSPDRHRLFFVVASEEVGRQMLERLSLQGFSPDQVRLVSPPRGFEKDAAYSAQLAAEIRNHATTHLFFGVGAPKSEIWVHRHRALLGDCYALPFGAAAEFYVGARSRAPKLMQAAGLEWLYRLAQEPGRLFRRYAVDSWTFLAILARDLSGDWREAPADRRAVPRLPLQQA